MSTVFIIVGVLVYHVGGVSKYSGKDVCEGGQRMV